MTDAEWESFLRGHPTLFHMAECGSWDSIQAHGLLSTTAALDKFGTRPADRDPIEAQRRPQGVTVGPVRIRDQRTMTDAVLARCLADGLTPTHWYRLLNGKVFFWPTRARLLRFLAAGTYRAQEHDVLEIDAQSLCQAYRDRIALCGINSGAPFPMKPAQRGLATFLPIERFASKRARDAGVVEVTIDGSVPDIARFVRRVVRMQHNKPDVVIFAR